MAADELTCKELVELVTDYLEEDLSPADRVRFDAHLGECDGCHTYLEQMKQTIRTVGKLTEETASPQAKKLLLDAFRKWKRS